jgi:hypothetical protein
MIMVVVTEVDMSRSMGGGNGPIRGGDKKKEGNLLHKLLSELMPGRPKSDHDLGASRHVDDLYTKKSETYRDPDDAY